MSLVSLPRVTLAIYSWTPPADVKQNLSVVSSATNLKKKPRSFALLHMVPHLTPWAHFINQL
jgi:hypothetical protein